MKWISSAFLGRFAALLKLQIINIIVWVLIVLIIGSLVFANRSTKAAAYSRLTSPIQSVRQAEILSLAKMGGLAYALTATEDPSTPSISPENVRSNAIREEDSADFDKMIDQGIVPSQTAMDNLFLLSKDSDSKVQNNAYSGLAIVGRRGKENLHELIRRLSDGDPDIRTAAATAIGQIKGQHTVQLVAPLLKIPEAADAAQTALVNIGKQSVPALSQMLPNASPDLRALIVNALGGIGDLSGVPALLTQVNTQPPSPQIHRLALAALANVVMSSVPERPVSSSAKPASAARPMALTTRPLQDQELTVFDLTEGLGDPEEDSYVRTREALALGRIGGPVAAMTLVSALGDLDSRVAKSAITGLQEVGPSAVSVIAPSTSSNDVVVRIGAASALGRIGDSGALAEIRRSLSDPSADVRQAAVEGLGISANPASIPLLAAALSDPDGQVASTAGDSLHLLGNRAIHALIDALGSSNQATALYASQALRQIGPPAEPALAHALSGSAPSKQVWIAVVLGQIQDRRAKSTLTILSQKGSPRVRWAANQALQELG